MGLYSFQQQAVDFHLAHHYSLNCSEMGLGKTRMALETAARVKTSPLVIGPAFLKWTWLNEAKRNNQVIHYIPYSMLHRVKLADVKGFDFWIADEVHYVKNPTALRTHAFYSLLKTCLPQYFIGLTGTPIKNRVPDFWTLLAFCGLNPKNTSGTKLAGELAHYRKFSRYFCFTELMDIRGRKIEKFKGIKPERIDEFKALLKDKMIRFKVGDVYQQLPKLVRKEVLLKIPKAPQDPRLKEIFQAYMSGHKVDSTAKKSSALLKAKATAEYCNDLIDGGSGPLVVFTDHVEPAKALSEAISGSLIVTGQTPMEVRQTAVSRFQTGSVSALVATIGSLSVGVTLTASKHVVFNDLSWVPADNLQAEKRIHRIGQDNVCFAHYIDSTATDQYIRGTLFEKLATIERALGDD